MAIYTLDSSGRKTNIFDGFYIDQTESEGRYFSTESIVLNKRQKDCLWKQRTHHRSENGSLGFIETLHKQ